MAADARRPNIVFLLTDDQRWDTLGVYGNRIIQTPHLDRLAQRGVLFEHAFVTTSICMTNRASIFTGQYASRHGINDFRTSFTPEQLSQTYPALLKQAGYRIGFIGKWGVGRPPEGLFDYDRGWPGQNVFFPEGPEGRHLTRIHGDQALEFLDGAPRDQPFCLSISFKAPHAQDTPNVHEQAFPYDPSLARLYQDVTIPPPPAASSEYFDRLPEFLKNTENRARWAVRFWGPERYQFSVKSYYRLITGVDVQVGRIVQKLQEAGLADNTIIIFTSDHGFYLGDYGFAGKWYPHEVSIRVPLIVYDPRPGAPRGVRLEPMALTLDMGPTMLEMAGVEVPPSMQGKSLIPLMKSDAPDATSWRDSFFYEHHFANPRIPRSEGVRTTRWKYIRYIDSEPLFEELYDLHADPYELVNLAALPQYADRLSEMRGQWEQWRKRAK